MREFNFFDRIYIFIGIPWLFLAIFTSRMFTELKIALLAAIMVFCLIEKMAYRIPFKPSYFKYVLCFILYCTFSLIIGILSGYEFEITKDFPLVQYYFITPICVLFFATAFHKRRRKTALWVIIKYFTLLLVLLDSLKVSLFVMGIEPAILDFIMMASFGTEDESLTLRVTNEGALFFLLPIFVFLLFQAENKKDQVTYFFIVIFGIVYSVLSGRKMLEVLVLASAIFSIVYRGGHIKIRNLFSGRILKIFILITILYVLFQYVFQNLSNTLGIDDIIGKALRTLSEGFSSGAEGVTKRQQNSSALINLWMESPIWGNGLNAYAQNSIANSDNKWSYEVFAQAWLAQTGIIGFILLCTAIKNIIMKLRLNGILYNDNKYFALLTGFICFIIGGLSNPLIYFVWPWSIVLIYSNVEINE